MNEPERQSDEIVPNTRLISGVRPLSECLATVDTDEGRERVRAYLDSKPFPHYEPVPDDPGVFIRIEKDGTRTKLKFVDGGIEATE